LGKNRGKKFPLSLFFHPHQHIGGEKKGRGKNQKKVRAAFYYKKIKSIQLNV
jgi:hypothetical protein